MQYTAGYTTVPEAVQEACAKWVAIAYYDAQRDPSLTSQAIHGAISQAWSGGQAPGPQPPPNVAKLLAPYRRDTVATNQG